LHKNIKEEICTVVIRKSDVKPAKYLLIDDQSNVQEFYYPYILGLKEDMKNLEDKAG